MFSILTSRLAFVLLFDTHPHKGSPWLCLNMRRVRKCGSGESASHRERFTPQLAGIDSTHGRTEDCTTSARCASMREQSPSKLATEVSARTALLVGEQARSELQGTGCARPVCSSRLG